MLQSLEVVTVKEGVGGVEAIHCQYIHSQYVLSKEEKYIFPNIHVIQQPSMVHLKGLL